MHCELACQLLFSNYFRIARKSPNIGDIVAVTSTMRLRSTFANTRGVCATINTKKVLQTEIGRLMTERTQFNFLAFYRALNTTVQIRSTNWKEVSNQTGVSQTTLSRMSKGRQPDAASLTALSAWSGLNPTDFIAGPKHNREPIAMVGKLLREDPNLDSAGADALETIIAAAYDRFKHTAVDD